MSDGENDVPSQFVDTIRRRTKLPKRGFSRKTLLDDLTGKGFSEDVALLAVNEYERVTGKRNFQDTRRKGLLLACVLRVYKDKGFLFDLLSVAAQMQVVPATTSRGVRLYYELLGEMGEGVASLECEPMGYVRLLLRQLASVDEGSWCTSGDLPRTSEGVLDVEHVCRCVESILGYCSRLDVVSATKSSTPRCVAAASVYFHFVATGVSVDRRLYAGLVGCAVVSVDKGSADIATALKRLRESAVGVTQMM
jgi:hypothetical protein